VKILEEPIASVTITAGTAYTLDLQGVFCDPEDDPMTYTISGNAPDGLSVSSDSLSGVISAPGHYQITVYACDGNSHPCTPTNSFFIEVVN